MKRLLSIVSAWLWWTAFFGIVGVIQQWIFEPHFIWFELLACPPSGAAFLMCLDWYQRNTGFPVVICADYRDRNDSRR
jgi:hypothetical protein